MNGSYMKMCLKQGKMIRTPYPDLADEHTTHEKRIWDFKMTKIIKTEHVLEGNLQNLFAVLMSICNSETKHQVESSLEFNALETTLDSMGILALINKLVYTGGANNKHVQHKYGNKYTRLNESNDGVALQQQATNKRKAIKRKKSCATNVGNLDITQMKVETLKTSNTNNTGKKEQISYYLRKMLSIAAQEAGIIPTFNKYEELQMSDDDNEHKELE